MMRLLARLLAAVLFLTLAVDASAAEAATRPSAPRSVRATPLNHAVKVTWAAPSSNGGASIDQYAVQRRTSTTAWATVKRTSGSARSWTSTGLTNGRKYYFRVLAHNRRGYGTASATVSATPRTVPLSPRALSADTYLLGFGAYWYAPLGNGGAPIDFYLVEISLDGATWTTPKKSTVAATVDLPLEFKGLTQGARYWLRVRAHNAAGYSVSTGAGPYRAYTTAGPVQGLTAVAGNGTVDLDWTAPIYSTNNNIGTVPRGIPQASSYKIEKSTDAGLTWTSATTTSATSLTLTGLTNGINHLFRVSAASQFRLSAASLTDLAYGSTQLTQSVIPIGAPTVPRNLAYVWDPIVLDYALTWTAPASNGGIALERYELQHWNDTTVPPYSTTDLGANSTSAPAGLYAVQDSVHIRACNGPLPSDCSAWTDPVAPIPGPVTNATAVPSRGGTGPVVTLDWDAPETTATVTSYEIARSDDAGDTWEVLEPDETLTDYIDESAVYETDYIYRIIAKGPTGSGGWVLKNVTTGPTYFLSVTPSEIEVDELSSGTFDVSLGNVALADTEIVVETSNAMALLPSSATVTIPAGQTSATVTIDAPYDPNSISEEVTITLRLGTQEVTVTVTVVDTAP